MPFSISSLAASSGDRFGFVSDDDCFGFLAKPSLWGGMERRRRSTESSARSARTLTVLMMSSRRDWKWFVRMLDFYSSID